MLGLYFGFKLLSAKSSFLGNRQLILRGEADHYVDIGASALGNITRIENSSELLPSALISAQHYEVDLKKQLHDAKIELAKPFLKEHELKEKLQKQIGLNIKMEHEVYSNAVLESEPAAEKSIEKGGMER